MHIYKNNSGYSFKGIPYRIAFYFYRLIPDELTNWISKNTFSNKIKIKIRGVLARGCTREDIYSSTYYLYVDKEAQKSADAITQMICMLFSPKSVIDIGCGTGALLHKIQKTLELTSTEKNVRCKGLEYSEAAIQVCRSRKLNVDKFDIELNLSNIDEKDIFDVAISLEVAEHISPNAGDSLVRLLCVKSKNIVFSAATPGQGGGVDHINEQPHEYWIERFNRSQYQIDIASTKTFRDFLRKKQVASFYSENIMIFKSSPNSH